MTQCLLAHPKCRCEDSLMRPRGISWLATYLHNLPHLASLFRHDICTQWSFDSIRFALRLRFMLPKFRDSDSKSIFRQDKIAQERHPDKGFPGCEFPFPPIDWNQVKARNMSLRCCVRTHASRTVEIYICRRRHVGGVHLFKKQKMTQPLLAHPKCL